MRTGTTTCTATFLYFFYISLYTSLKMENIHPIRQQYFENEFEQRTNGRAEKLLLEESCDKANIFLTCRAGGI